MPQTGIDGNFITGLNIEVVKILDIISSRKWLRTAFSEGSGTFDLARGVGTQTYRQTQIIPMAELTNNNKTLSSFDPKSDFVSINIDQTFGRQVVLPRYDLDRIATQPDSMAAAAIVSQWEENIALSINQWLDIHLADFIKNDVAGDTTRVVFANDNAGNWYTYDATWTPEKHSQETRSLLNKLQWIKADIARSSTINYFGINDADQYIKLTISNLFKPFFSTSFVTLTYAAGAFELFLNGYNEEFYLGTIKCSENIYLDRQFVANAVDNPAGAFATDLRNILGILYHVESIGMPMLMETVMQWRLDSNPNLITINPTGLWGIGRVRNAKNLLQIIVRTKADGTPATWNNTNKSWGIA